MEKFEEAENYFNKSREIIESNYGYNYPLTATIYNRLALLSKNKDEYNTSLEYSEKSITILKRLFGDNCSEQLEPLNNIGTVYKKNGRFRDAEEIILRAKEICENDYGEKHLHTALVYSNLADLYQLMNNLIKAEYYYDKALHIRITLLGESHYKTSKSYFNKGNIYYLKDDNEEALKLYRKAQLYSTTNKVEIELKGLAKYYQAPLDNDNITKKIGKDHLGKVSNNIAGAYYNMKKFEEAIENYKQAENLYREAHGDDYPSKADLNYPLAICYYELEQYDAAVDCYEIVLAIKSAEMGEENVYIAELLARLATSKYLARRNVESIPYAAKALQIYAKFPDEIDHLFSMFSLVAHAYHNLENYNQAETFFLKLIELKEQRFEFPFQGLIRDYQNVKGLYWATKEYDKSLYFAEKEIELLKALYGDDDSNVASAIAGINRIKSAIENQDQDQQNKDDKTENLNELLDNHDSSAKEHYNNGRYADAKVFYQKMLDKYLQIYENDHQEIINSSFNIANCDCQMENYEDALMMFEKILAILIEKSNVVNQDLLDCYDWMGYCHYWIENYPSAIENYQKAVELSKEMYGEKSEETDDIIFNLAKTYYYSDDNDKAKALFIKSLKFREENFGKDSEEVSKAQEWLEEFV